MLRATHLFLAFATLLPGSVVASAQQGASAARQTSPRTIHLDVVVTPKSGRPVSGLAEQDFTLTDNKAARPLVSFRAVTAAQDPVKVIVLIDAVNIDFTRVAYARQQVQKFLKADGGKLDHPTTIAVLTDKGTVFQRELTEDGNALSASLDHYTIGLREIRHDAGIWGANDRVQISLMAVQQLAAYGAGLPGRKIVVWVSPGWPLLSGSRIDLDATQQRQIFGNVVAFSRELQQANVTLYNVNPLGPEEGLLRQDYYQEFVKGVSKPSQTDLADLSLQVLALQSGGLSFNGTSDVAGNLKKCVADTEAWYEISFEGSPAEQPNEYHHVQVNVEKPGLSARTRDGYYAQP